VVRTGIILSMRTCCFAFLTLSVCLGCTSGTRHRMAPGETAVEVAARHGLSVERVCWLNKLDHSWSGAPGQELFLPVTSSEQRRTVSSQPVPRQPSPASKTGSGPTSKAPPAKPRTQRRVEPKPLLKTEKIPTELRFSLPLDGACQIRTPYGLVDGVMHHGVDFLAPEGTPVLAAESGKVIYSDDDIRGYGNLVILKHSGQFTTVYAHNQRNLVAAGDIVRKGEAIASVGSTGTQPPAHLHFEIRRGVSSLDPLDYLSGCGEAKVAGFLPEP